MWVLRASGKSNLLRGSLWFLLIASAATLGVFRFGNTLTISTPRLIQEVCSKENARSQTGSPGGIPSSVGSPAMLVLVDLKWKETNQKICYCIMCKYKTSKTASWLLSQCQANQCCQNDTANIKTRLLFYNSKAQVCWRASTKPASTHHLISQLAIFWPHFFPSLPWWLEVKTSRQVARERLWHSFVSFSGGEQSANFDDQCPLRSCWRHLQREMAASKNNPLESSSSLSKIHCSSLRFTGAY